MKIKILSKLYQKVKIEKQGDVYVLYSREIEKMWPKKTYTPWVKKLTTSSLDKAIQMKHNIWMIILRDLGYRSDLLYKRKKAKLKLK